MYKVRVGRNAQKKLVRISEPFYTKIKIAILDLGKEPRPKSCRKLKGRDGYRIRISDYRIIYEIHDSLRLVDIIEVGHRKNIYE